MGRWFTNVILWLIVLVFSGCSYAAGDPVVRLIDPPSKILLVGNSFTYYNDSLHNHLRRLMASADPAIASEPRLRIMTISGARLSEHTPAYEAMIASENWDAVVLQGHSKGPISEETAADFKFAARAFDKINRARGANTVFFMTWAYEGEPQMTAALNASYSQIGNELGALVVPVGLAFERAGVDAPEIRLRHADKRHPTLAGTYLAACVFYAALFNETPVGLSYEATLDSSTATTLQRIAQRTILDYY